MVLLLFPAQPATAEDNPDVRRIANYWSQRRPEQAHALIDSLLPTARTAGDTVQLMKLLGWQGRMHGALGHGAEALPPLNETLALAQAVDDTVFQCMACRWLAVSYTIQGHYEKGGRYYDQLVVLARSAGETTFLGWGLSGQGFYRSLAGDEIGAQAKYRNSISLFRQQGLAEAENFVLQLLGESLADQGAFPEARRCYERSGQIGRETGDLFLQGLSCSNLGRLDTQLGDPQAGLNNFREASRLFRLDGSLHAGLEVRLQMADCLATLEMVELAAEELAAIQAEAAAEGFLKIQADVLIQRTRLEMATGRPSQVISDLQFFLDGPLSLDGDTECAVTHALVKAILERDGPGPALDFLVPKLDKLRSRAGRTEILDLELAKATLLQKTGRYQQGLDLLLAVADEADSLQLVGLELQALPPAAAAAAALGDDSLSLELLNRSSRVWLKNRALPVDPHWREVYGAQSRHIYVNLAELLLRYPPEDPVSRRIARAFDAVQVFKARTLEERMAGPGIETGNLSPITLEQIQTEILAPNQVFLDYFLGEDGGLVFQVSRDSCQVFPLPGNREIGNRLQIFHDFISDPGRFPENAAGKALVQQVAGRISESILGPTVGTFPGDCQIIWSPDGVLNLFPLALILDQPRQSLFRIPSASVLGDLHNRDHPAADHPATILAIGGVRDDLPAIAGELKDLGNYRSARVQTSLATGEIGPQLVSSDLLHFATHAYADALSPWKSYLEIPLADGAKNFRLDAAAITRMRLPAQLVVLAGCESAGGRIMGGEGVPSLANAFLSAGVPAVLATLWPVDDEATRVLFSHFYRHLAAGGTTAMALHAAQNDLAKSDRYSDPFFWGGFVLVGDGNLEIRLERRSSRRHYFYWVLLPGFFLLAGRRIFRS